MSCNTGSPFRVVSTKKYAVISCAKATITRLSGLLILRRLQNESLLALDVAIMVQN
jgi:hypothetical protein